MSLRIRRGGFTGGAPPPPEAFGPLPSAQFVRDNARPRTVADPGGGVTFTSRLDLQNKINANPANTLFKASGGTTYDWDAAILPSTKHPRIYFLGDPNTTIINGAGREIAGVAGSTSGGEIHGGKWKNFGTASEAGTSGLALFLRNGWTVQDVICEFNFNTGIKCSVDSGGNITVQRAILRSNGRYGMSSGIFSGLATDWGPGNCLFEDIEISNNNTRQLGVGGDAGGTKFSSGTHDSVWRRIWAHHNYGSGLWWDGFHFNNLAEDIVSENNRNWGGFVEFGHGSNMFRRWYLKDNCDDPILDPGSWFEVVQFLISTTDGTTLGNLSGNRVTTGIPGGTGVTFRDSVVDGIERAMGTIAHDGHFMNSKDHHFLHNQVWLRGIPTGQGGSGQVGAQDTDSDLDLFAQVIEFDQNEYHVANAALQYWKWGGTVGSGLTWTEWRAFGKDASSTMVEI